MKENSLKLIKTEIKELQKEITQNALLKQRYDRNKIELLKYAVEEKSKIVTLKQIIKKLNLELTNTNADKEKIKFDFIMTEKQKSQVLEKLLKVNATGHEFFARAQSNIKHK